ncbi:hypothetical protein B0T19DRAFT_397649 [Cercophora scortea]|uniref:Uncharacterized protein n=1 Tax=Cercophora scortea TaxID=314031 RepID=A0AAE0IV60_9PEZI|nr:hypothetical protein B0T19DRAFT_397649 [Cercophora scortea]
MHISTTLISTFALGFSYMLNSVAAGSIPGSEGLYMAPARRADLLDVNDNPHLVITDTLSPVSASANFTMLAVMDSTVYGASAPSATEATASPTESDDLAGPGPTETGSAHRKKSTITKTFEHFCCNSSCRRCTDVSCNDDGDCERDWAGLNVPIDADTCCHLHIERKGGKVDAVYNTNHRWVGDCKVYLGTKVNEIGT